MKGKENRERSKAEKQGKEKKGGGEEIKDLKRSDKKPKQEEREQGKGKER